MQEAAEGAKTMDEVGDNITKENKAVDATIATDEEKAHKGKEQAATNEALAKRIREMSD